MAGAVLIALVVLPVFRVLDHPHTGHAGAATVAWTNAAWSLLGAGLLLLLVPALVGALARPPAAAVAAVYRAGAVLRALGPTRHAAALAAVTLLATALFARAGLGGQPHHIDAFAQLLQARFWAAGMLAGPAEAAEFWHVQNSLQTAHGWVSQYPPTHVALLAVGSRLGAAWLVGPVLAAVTVLFTALTAERLLPGRAAARLGAALLAVSPFFIALAGSFMNHVSAAAFLAVAGWAAVRAATGARRWALLAGLALAVAFGARPLSAIAIGGVLVMGPWLAWSSRRRLLENGVLAGLGAAPPLLALALYNARFFGAPHRFGYDVVLGPSAGLGFGVDPWGNRYGALEALGYTAADLIHLSGTLFEASVPVVLLAGLFLLFAPRLAPGERVIAAAALAPVAAGAVYWHHGLYMGPRMLLEAAPMWSLLFVLGATHLYRRLPGRRAAGAGDRNGAVVRYSARGAYATALVTGVLLGVGVLGPQRLLAYRAPEPPWAAALTTAASDAPALVFVHDAWQARLAMRLAIAGLRLDEAETLLRQNDTCDVHRFTLRAVGLFGDAAQRVAGTAAPAPAVSAAAAHAAGLDTARRAAPLPPRVTLSPGSVARIGPGGLGHRDCLAQAHADRFGVFDIAPLLVRGALPGSDAVGTLYVRDHGPLHNRRALAAFGARTPRVLAAIEPGGPPLLLDYEDGMRLLWGESGEW